MDYADIIQIAQDLLALHTKFIIHGYRMGDFHFAHINYLKVSGGEFGGLMSLKQPGKIDFQDGKLGYFVCYHRCPQCEKNVKVILPRAEYNKTRDALARSQRHTPKEVIKRGLMDIANRL